MTVGEGIFYSSIVLSIVALFIATKDRWNWKKIVVRATLGLVLIVALGGAAIYGWISYIERPQKPVAASEFWGLSLSASKGDVKFLKGEPAYIRASKGNDDREYWMFGDSEQIKALGKEGKIAWHSHLIEFRGDKIRSIQYVGNESWRGPRLHGVSIGDSLDSVTHLLGNPSYVSISDDELTRIVVYANLHSYFELEKNQVRTLGVFNPQFNPPRYSKESKS